MIHVLASQRLALFHLLASANISLSSVAERDSFPPRGSLRENPFTLHNRVEKWQIKPLFSAKSCICVVFAMLALPQIRLPLGGKLSRSATDEGGYISAHVEKYLSPATE